MTEEEAKTKWCPFVRLAGVTHDGVAQVAAGNRAAIFERNRSEATFNNNPESCRCIASACMAWRWRHYWEEFTDKPAEPVKEDGGFCGLAGKP